MNKGKFGIIDILIVISIVIATIIGISLARKPELVEQADSQVINYSFEVTNVGEEFIDNMNIGDSLYHSSKDTYLGELLDYEVSPSQIFHRDTEKGEVVILDSPMHIDVKMIIEVEARVQNGILKVEDEDIMVGRGLPIKGKGYASYGFIVEIEE